MSDSFHTTYSWTWKNYGYEKYVIMNERGAEIASTHRRKYARLIAAAPDLLATVKECLATMAVMAEQISQMEGMFDDNDGSIADALKDFDNAHEMASTAIAKAMGEDEV